MPNFDFSIRDACSKDLGEICKLGALLNTINLPASKSELEQVIYLSERSFSLEESDPANRSFLFALVDKKDKVIGVSQVIAQHGTLASPHNYFQITIDERYSPTLNKYFRHKTLKLVQNFEGPTEIGSLVLAKKYRSHPARLGRQLSFVRFLFMAMNKNFFKDQVIAELMPPLGPNFASALWNAIGHKFTGLDYATADMLSRKNKEFIKSLFPAGDIYINLLPAPAQEVIGLIGPESQAAAHLLSSIGFRYCQRVDPFDGGPHYEANLDEISIITNTREGFVSVSKETENNAGLFGFFAPAMPSGKRFRAVQTSYSFDNASGAFLLAKHHKDSLDLSINSKIWGLSLA